MTCDDCKWKAENECPWDLMYDKPGVDYADDCMDFRSKGEKKNFLDEFNKPHTPEEEHRIAAAAKLFRDEVK